MTSKSRALLHIVLVLAIASALPACGKKGNRNPIGLDPTPIPEPTPEPVSDWQYLVDGAGNRGPVRVRLLWVNPPSGSMLQPPSFFVSFKAEVCMDSVSNPTNSPNLIGMNVRVYPSQDGRLTWGPTSVNSSNGVDLWNVTNGGCITVSRLPVEMGGVPGNQFLGFHPGATHLLFVATYSMAQRVDGVVRLPYLAVNPPAACPSTDEIARTTLEVRCDLRSGHFLDYKW